MSEKRRRIRVVANALQDAANSLDGFCRKDVLADASLIGAAYPFALARTHLRDVDQVLTEWGASLNLPQIAAPCHDAQLQALRQSQTICSGLSTLMRKRRALDDLLTHAQTIAARQTPPDESAPPPYTHAVSSSATLPTQAVPLASKLSHS